MLNEQVWRRRLDEGTVDTERVVEVFRTPAYHDYHWIANPAVDDRLGAGTTAAIAEALTALDAGDAEHAEILELFGAGSFVPSEPSNYTEIEEIGRTLGLITE